MLFSWFLYCAIVTWEVTIGGNWMKGIWYSLYYFCTFLWVFNYCKINSSFFSFFIKGLPEGQAHIIFVRQGWLVSYTAHLLACHPAALGSDSAFLDLFAWPESSSWVYREHFTVVLAQTNRIWHPVDVITLLGASVFEEYDSFLWLVFLWSAYN